MSPAALILAAALAVPAPDAPPDPAVRVCELLVRQALRRPDSFTPTARPALRRDSVELAYSYLDAHGRRAGATQTCRFGLSPRDLRFHVEPLRRDHLAARLAATRAKLEQAATDRERLMIRSELFDIAREVFVQDDRAKRAERAATAEGIYPIPPSRTALRAE